MTDILIGVFGLALLVAAVWDIARFEIPDTVSILLILVGAGAILAGGDAGARLLNHAAVAGGLFGFGLLLFLRGGFGGGDVKLLAAVGFWFGWPGVLSYLFVVALAGGALSVVVLLVRAFPLSARAPGWYVRLHGETGVPYGVALAVGGIYFAALAQKAVTAGWVFD